MPLPPHVSGEAIGARLRTHNVEVLLAPLLPASEHTPILAKQVELSRARSDFLLLEYERLLPVLTRPDCRPVLLKGGALALGSYAEPSERWFLDLVLLARRLEPADWGYLLAESQSTGMAKALSLVLHNMK